MHGLRTYYDNSDAETGTQVGCPISGEDGTSGRHCAPGAFLCQGEYATYSQLLPPPTLHICGFPIFALLRQDLTGRIT